MKFEKKIEIFDKLTDHYKSEIRDYLKTDMKKLKKGFKKLLTENAEEFDLKSSNPIYSTDYFKIIGRVKGKSSFREKLIRKNLGLDLLNNFDLSQEKFEENKNLASLDIMKFDDIVGLRIVCDLHKDCPNVLRLISNNIASLTKSKITFLPGELETQPQTMKNGLEIYRIKGLYNGKTGFELQIKSKIEEAWGELDHFIFYKDYSFFPTKTTVQKTMNNVGTLLNEIEVILYDLRDSKDFYEEGLNQQETLEKIDKCFSTTLKKSLGFKYQLEKLTSIIDHLVKSFESDILEYENEELSFAYLEFENKHSNKEYEDLRNLNFELKILEAIFIKIYSAKNGEVKKENYHEAQAHFINCLKENICRILKENRKIDTENTESYKNQIDLQIKSAAGVEILTSPKKHLDSFKYLRAMSDLYTEVFIEEMEEEEDTGEVYFSTTLKNIIENFIIGAHFNSNLKIVKNILNNDIQGNINVEIDKLVQFGQFPKQQKQIEKYLNIITKTLQDVDKDK